jgi:tetratricopeptide (TPR) repeat protein
VDRLGRIDMLLKMLETEPEDIFVNYTLGLEYVAELDLERGQSQFNKVLALDPGYVPAYYQLGKLFESQLKNAEALDYFKKGLKKAVEQDKHKTAGEFREAISNLEED